MPAKSLLLALLLLPAAAFAADVAGETVTAGTHAQLASQAADLDMVHMHLHHVLNCLVGPSGDGFDKSQINPCAGSGNGILPDTTDATKVPTLMTAEAKAKAGIASSDITVAKQDASDAYAALQAAK